MQPLPAGRSHGALACPPHVHKHDLRRRRILRCRCSRTIAARRSLRHLRSCAQVLIPACGGAASQRPHSPPRSSATESSNHRALRRRSPQRVTVSGSAWRWCWSRTTTRSALSRCRAETYRSRPGVIMPTTPRAHPPRARSARCTEGYANGNLTARWIRDGATRHATPVSEYRSRLGDRRGPVQLGVAASSASRHTENGRRSGAECSSGRRSPPHLRDHRRLGTVTRCQDERSPRLPTEVPGP